MNHCGAMHQPEQDAQSGDPEGFSLALTPSANMQMLPSPQAASAQLILTNDNPSIGKRL